MDVMHYVQAARLRTLPLSLSGIIVGSFLAASQGAFNWKICVLALLTTTGFQILSNFANDYGDGVKGTDNDDRVGPERALQSGAISPKQMLRAIIITVILTLSIAIGLIYVSFGKDDFLLSLLFFGLGICSIVAAIKYTMGSNAYGYSGLGDVFVFLFFGLLSVLGSFFLFTKQLEWELLFPACVLGCLSAAVLNLNNMRDHDSDKKSNKNTLVVKMGVQKARIYHYILIALAFTLSVLYVVLNYEKPIQWLFLIAFIPIASHLRKVVNTRDSRLLDPELKVVALSTFLFSLLFGLGQIL